ncbi:MAG: SMC-Scp complex subunit ScpB [bacterium]|nr:SMC-Scp complex subunit ScpB [bacterium]
MNLENKIEAILFFKGEPVSLKKLMDILKISAEELNAIVFNLKKNLENRGIVLQDNNQELVLGTHPEVSDLIEDLQKEDINKDLSKASLETLSIILYKDGVSRAEIDYIRGVNSTFTLRLLAIRGLIEKISDKKDARKFIYNPSLLLLGYLGVSNVNELPDYEDVHNKIHQTVKELENLENEDNTQ